MYELIIVDIYSTLTYISDYSNIMVLDLPNLLTFGGGVEQCMGVSPKNSSHC